MGVGVLSMRRVLQEPRRPGTHDSAGRWQSSRPDVLGRRGTVSALIHTEDRNNRRVRKVVGQVSAGVLGARRGLPLLLAILACAWLLYLPGRAGAQPDSGAGRALVAASHPLAAEAGAEMLRRGGHAADAPAAVPFALNGGEPPFS